MVAQSPQMPQGEPLRLYMIQRKRALVTELRAVEAFLASTTPPEPPDPPATVARQATPREWQNEDERRTA